MALGARHLDDVGFEVKAIGREPVCLEKAQAGVHNHAVQQGKRLVIGKHALAVRTLHTSQGLVNARAVFWR